MEEGLYSSDWVKQKQRCSGASTKPSLSILGGHNYQTINWTLVNKSQQEIADKPRRSTFSMGKDMPNQDALLAYQYVAQLNKTVIKHLVTQNQKENILERTNSGNSAIQESFGVTLQPITKSQNSWIVKDKQLIHQCFEILYNFSAQNYFEIVHSTQTKMKVRRVLSDNIFKILCNFCFVSSRKFIELEMKQMGDAIELNITPKIVETEKYRGIIEYALWKADLILLEEKAKIQYFLRDKQQRIKLLINQPSIKSNQNLESAENILIKQYISVTETLTQQYFQTQPNLTAEGKLQISTKIFQDLNINSHFTQITKQNDKKIDLMKMKFKNKGLPDCLEFLEINSDGYIIDLDVLPFNQSIAILDKIASTQTIEEKLVVFKEYYTNLEKQSKEIIIKKQSFQELIMRLLILTIIYSNATSLYRDAQMSNIYCKVSGEDRKLERGIIEKIQSALDHIKNSFFHCQ